MFYTVLSGGFSTDHVEETIMEAPKVPTLDLKNKRKPPTAGPIATDDDDRNLSVIDPGGDYGQQNPEVCVCELHWHHGDRLDFTLIELLSFFSVFCCRAGFGYPNRYPVLGNTEVVSPCLPRGL